MQAGDLGLREHSAGHPPPRTPAPWRASCSATTACARCPAWRCPPAPPRPGPRLAAAQPSPSAPLPPSRSPESSPRSAPVTTCAPGTALWPALNQCRTSARNLMSWGGCQQKLSGSRWGDCPHQLAVSKQYHHRGEFTQDQKYIQSGAFASRTDQFSTMLDVKHRYSQKESWCSAKSRKRRARPLEGSSYRSPLSGNQRPVRARKSACVFFHGSRAIFTSASWKACLMVEVTDE